MKILSGTSNKLLAGEIAKQLGGVLSPVEFFIFPDGEKRVRIEDTVADEDVLIVQSTSSPVDSNYMELFFLIDAAKRSGARSVTVVMPYMGYMRQNHVFRTGEAVSFDVILTTLGSLRVDKVIAYDLHSIKMTEEFKIPLVHLSALSIFAQEIKQRGQAESDTVLVSPDTGGLRRVKILSELLGDMAYITITKNRDTTTGEVRAVSVDGNVKRKAIMVDDMISTGATLIKGAELLRSLGVEKIDVFATHGLFTNNAAYNLQESVITSVCVSDSVYLPPEKRFEKLTVLSLAPSIVQQIP